MSETRALLPIIAVSRASTRHPWAVVVIAAVVVALAVLSLSRLRVSASLEAMLGSQSEAAVAFHRVTTEFQAGEALLAIVEPMAVDRTRPPTREDRERTIALADALVWTLRQDPRTEDRIAWARCRQDPAYAAFARELLLPNAAFYLGEAGTRDFLERFEPGTLAEQFARNEALVASPGPAGEALSRTVLRDPLRLFELANAAGWGGFDAGAAVDPNSSPAPEFSKDGHAVLVRIASTSSMNDLEEANALVADVTTIARELGARAGKATGGNDSSHDIAVRLGGAYAISATSSGTIRFDAMVSTIVSVALLYGLFVVFYRRWLTPILIGVVAGAGMVVGFGVHALGAPTVSPLAAAVAAMLAGLGVDYGIHFVAHFDELRSRGLAAAEAATGAAEHMALPITTNCFTSIFGFVSLLPSPIEMLSDFAMLGAIGLIGAWIAAFTLLPALLVLTHRGASRVESRGARFGWIAGTVAARPRLWLSSALSLLFIVVGAAAVQGKGPQLEGDLTVLHPQPNEALRTTDEVIARFAGQGEMIPILVRVERQERLLAATFDTARALSSEACRSAGVVDVLGLHRLVPDSRMTQNVRDLLGRARPEVLLANFDAALAASAFDAAAYDGYRKFLGRMLGANEPPTIATLARYPSIVQRVFPTSAFTDGASPTQTLLIVRLDRTLRDRDRRGEVITTLRKALAQVPEATVAGLAAISEELEDTTGRGLPQSIGISVALVLCWLCLVFRRLSDVALALVPLVFAGVFTIAFMAVIGERFNPINSIAIPLLDGIAVDAGVFLVSVARHARRGKLGRAAFVEHLRPTMHAVLLASATTITGFASLCATHTPAIRSLGMIAAIGIAASFCGAACVLVPLLLRQMDSSGTPPAKEGN